MHKTINYFKKIFGLLTVLLIFNLIVTPSVLLASQPERTAYPLPQGKYEQIDFEESFATDAFSCSISGILANAISSMITQSVAAATGALLGTETPVVESSLRLKEVGWSINIAGISVPIIPSWDSFAYCLVNTTIAYISQSTIQWIRSGFEGNPAFVDNPGRFFQQVADFEFENFLDDIAGELLCDPFRVQVINSVAQTYNRDYYGQQGYGRCSLYDGGNAGNIDAFLRGEYFDFDVWQRYTQSPANNPLGSYMLAQGELNRRITTQQNLIRIELDWGAGYFSWKDEDTGNTITPGTVIQSELETRLGLDEGRLILASEFDQVINELVNYLIKVALDETLGSVRR